MKLQTSTGVRSTLFPTTRLSITIWVNCSLIKATWIQPANTSNARNNLVTTFHRKCYVS